jgi:osmotically-inducible protein OsmY
MNVEKALRGTGIVLFGLVLSAPALGQSAPDKQAAMEKKVMALCVEKLGDDAKTIRATVVGDKVTLTGEVATRAVAELAEEVALSVEGIKNVDDQISAKNAKGFGKGKVQKEVNDAKLEVAVKKAIEKEVGEKFAKTIEVEVTGSWVSLRGTLPDASRKEFALKAVGKVEGVKKVVDLITVKK